LFTVSYDTCTFAGQPAEVVMNGCKYKFNASGVVTIEGCEAGKGIEIKIEGCTATIPAQGPLSTVKYTTLGAEPSRTVTAETAVTKISGTLDGTKAKCGGMEIGAFSEGEYTTGNTIVTAETDASPAVMADGWWL
jgi:hypothetical protein